MPWLINGMEDVELFDDLAAAFAKHWQRRFSNMEGFDIPTPKAISGTFNIHLTGEDGRLLEWGDAGFFFDYRGEK